MQLRTTLSCEAGSESTFVGCLDTSAGIHLRIGKLQQEALVHISVFTSQRTHNAITRRTVNLDVLCMLVTGRDGGVATSTSYWTMDVTQHRIESCFLEGTGKGACVLEVRQGNFAVALETEIKEIEILRYDRVRRP
jgi:hypothetical protein